VLMEEAKIRRWKVMRFESSTTSLAWCGPSDKYKFPLILSCVNPLDPVFTLGKLLDERASLMQRAGTSAASKRDVILC